MLLYSLPHDLIKATVVARPSRYNKSPYLADILIEGQEEPVVAHSPALGCNGYVAAGQTVWVMPNISEKTISKYTIYHAEQDGEIICIHPQVANSVARGLLDTSLVMPGLLGIKSEVTVGESRFDFAAATDDGRKVYIEVKSAPIADIVDALPRERVREIAALGDGPHASAAIFPYGNNPKAGLLSPRALKHIQHLHTLSSDATCVMLYITMRTDVDRLIISRRDAVYRAAVASAAAAGVDVQAWTIRWNGRHAYLGKSIPVIHE